MKMPLCHHFLPASVSRRCRQKQNAGLLKVILLTHTINMGSGSDNGENRTVKKKSAGFLKLWCTYLHAPSLDQRLIGPLVNFCISWPSQVLQMKKVLYTCKKLFCLSVNFLLLICCVSWMTRLACSVGVSTMGKIDFKLWQAENSSCSELSGVGHPRYSLLVPMWETPAMR